MNKNPVRGGQGAVRVRSRCGLSAVRAPVRRRGGNSTVCYINNIKWLSYFNVQYIYIYQHVHTVLYNANGYNHQTQGTREIHTRCFILKCTVWYFKGHCIFSAKNEMLIEN